MLLSVVLAESSAVLAMLLAKSLAVPAELSAVLAMLLAKSSAVQAMLSAMQAVASVVPSNESLAVEPAPFAVLVVLSAAQPVRFAAQQVVLLVQFAALPVLPWAQPVR